jgi:hypothetical protein
MSGDGIEGAACCILEICCGGEHQIDELAKKIDAEVSGINKPEAVKVARFILEHYDLAPVGTLKDFKRAIAAMARAYPPDPGY